MTAFIHPGLDVSKLSDEEITSKIYDLHSRIRYAFSNMNNSQTITQLQNILDSLLFEQNERIAREIAAHKAATQKSTIESDPEFASKDPKKDLQQISKRDDSRKRRQIPIITKDWMSKKSSN